MCKSLWKVVARCVHEIIWLVTSQKTFLFLHFHAVVELLAGSDSEQERLAARRGDREGLASDARHSN